MKYQRAVITTALIGLGMVGFTVPSQAGLTTFCDGTASDVTVPGDLVVRPGDSCELTDVVIQGRATVRPGANLLLENATVEGNLVVRDDGFANLVGTTVAGNTRLNAAFGVYTDASEHAGAVNATDAGFLFSVGSDFGGNVSSNGGETFIESGWLSRNLSTEGDLLTDIYDTVIERNVSVADSTYGGVVCESEIDGDVSYTGNGELVQLGAGTVSDCGFNVFGGDVSLADNSAASYVDGNVIRGDLTCSGNDPAPVVANNRIRGENDCASAEAAASRFSTRSQEEAQDRKAGALAKIEDRAGASEEEAEKAGPAFD